MKMIKRLLRDRKGISLTEVVVAMALVLLVTGAAIGIVAASAQADLSYRYKYEALTACENAADCLRYSQGNETKLQEALKSAGFKENTVESVWIIEKTINKKPVQTVKVYKEGNYYVVKYNDEIIYNYYVKTNP